MLYTTGNGIWLKETNLADGDGTFEDPGSQQRHLIAGDIYASKSIPGPSATLYKDSKWVAWLENQTIKAKPIWWGPARTRKVYSSPASTAITAPAIAAFGGRLVVVWGEGGRLFFTTSEYGVRWTAPIPHANALPSEAQAAPALAVHKGFLYVGVSESGHGLALHHPNYARMVLGPQLPSAGL